MAAAMAQECAPPAQLLPIVWRLRAGAVLSGALDAASAGLWGGFVGLGVADDEWTDFDGSDGGLAQDC